MSVKIIDDKVITDANRLSNINDLVNRIKSLHTDIALKGEEIESEKNKLKEISTEIFYQDIESDTPQYNSSHEFKTEHGVVRVSFKIDGRPLQEINGKPAEETLYKVFKEHAGELFEQTHTYQVTADLNTQLSQAADHPEIFRVALKDLTHEQLQILVREHPDWVNPQVIDPETYARLYPSCATKTTTIRSANGFVESVDKLEPAIKKSASKFLSKFFKLTLSPAVICGNKSKK